MRTMLGFVEVVQASTEDNCSNSDEEMVEKKKNPTRLWAGS